MENNPSKFREFLLSGVGRATMIALFYIIIFGIVMASVATDNPYIAVIEMFIFAYFGWKSLNKIQPNIFLIMPVSGWVIYFVVKFVLSFLIGIFIAPFQIAKMITNRLKLVLPSIISKSQSAFVPGRAIINNILISAELMHYLKPKK